MERRRKNISKMIVVIFFSGISLVKTGFIQGLSI